MASLSKLKPGQIVYEVCNRLMGNTTIRTATVAAYRVHSVNVDEGYVVASVGSAEGDRPVKKYRTRAVAKWRVSRPYLVQSTMHGLFWLARKPEVEKARAEGRIHECSRYFLIKPSLPTSS